MPKRQKPFASVLDEIPSLVQRPDAQARRDRSWDENNPAFSFRIRAGDAERLSTQAAALGLSRDALARALMGAALDALAGGWLILEIEQVVTDRQDKLGRRRLTARQEARGLWQPGELPATELPTR